MTSHDTDDGSRDVDDESRVTTNDGSHDVPMRLGRPLLPFSCIMMEIREATSVRCCRAAQLIRGLLWFDHLECLCKTVVRLQGSTFISINRRLM